MKLTLKKICIPLFRLKSFIIIFTFHKYSLIYEDYWRRTPCDNGKASAEVSEDNEETEAGDLRQELTNENDRE